MFSFICWLSEKRQQDSEPGLFFCFSLVIHQFNPLSAPLWGRPADSTLHLKAQGHVLTKLCQTAGASQDSSL